MSLNVGAFIQSLGILYELKFTIQNKFKNLKINVQHLSLNSF